MVIYIDRQLASPYGRDARRYTKGPWIESIPEHGYQGKETPQQAYRAGIALLGADFAGVSTEQQDLRLEKIEGTHFFQLLRAHTVEGMFCDPLHGGNIGMVGWKLIGFPGPRMNYRDQIDKHFGQDLQSGSHEPGANPSPPGQGSRRRRGVASHRQPERSSGTSYGFEWLAE